MSQLISVLLVLLILTSFSSSSPFQTTLSILPTSSSLFFSSSAYSPPTPFCVPLPGASSAPSSKPSYWEVHAWSTVGGMLGWFGAICGGLLVVVFPCLAQWRMVELQESLKDSDLPSAVRKRRQKMLTEHYELLDRGVAPWLWHQFRPVISVLLRGLSWPPRKIWDGIKGVGCVVPVVSSLFNKLRRKRTVGLILVRHQPHSGARRIWPGGSNTSRPCAPWGHTPLPERWISTLTWCSGLRQ
jgi:hypothetical protein